jgi:hypothetical protein
MEFTSLSRSAEIISFGLVNNKKGFYFENKNWSFQTLKDSPKQKDWIKQNVVPHLLFADSFDTVYKTTLNQLNLETYTIHDSIDNMLPHIEAWLKQYEHVVIVGDVLAYDWVLFCEIFGGAQHLPKNIFYIPIDIAAMLYDRGGKMFADESRLDIYSEYAENTYKFFDIKPHNSLYDAYVIKYIFENVIKGKK